MKKREKALIITTIIAPILFAATCATVFFALFWRAPNDRHVIEIPQFAGQTEGAVGAPADIELVKEYSFSESVPKGEIIAQEPNAYAKRKLRQGEKCQVKLTVSLGEETHTLPDLRGLAYNEALAKLRMFGVEIKTVYQNRIDGESGRVLSTDPKSGSEIKSGERITVYVSRNPGRSSVKVGNYREKRQEEAVLSLMLDGLTIGEIIGVPSLLPSGTVLDQSIPENAYLPYGSKIDLVVSEGEMNENNERSPFFGGVTE